MEPRNRFEGMNSTSLCSLAGQNDKPIPTRFLAPIGWLKILAQTKYFIGLELVRLVGSVAPNTAMPNRFH
jgi:hypothetical protein